LKFTKSCKNASKNEIYLQDIYQSSNHWNQEMFAISLSTCSRYNQCPLFMTVRHIFEISEDDHPSSVTHARDNWLTLDLANAFVSPGVNSRGELVPSHGASRRRLGDNMYIKNTTLFTTHFIHKTGHRTTRVILIDILYTLDSASNYSAIQKLKPWLQTQDIPMKWEDSYVFYFLKRELKH
jgi:hypothetical protein